jgi:hypothetical protein
LRLAGRGGGRGHDGRYECGTDDAGGWGGVRVAGSVKVFFSEEKKQKTFVHWYLRPPGQVCQSAKIFCFFVSKKKTSLT